VVEHTSTDAMWQTQGPKEEGSLAGAGATRPAGRLAGREMVRIDSSGSASRVTRTSTWSGSSTSTFWGLVSNDEGTSSTSSPHATMMKVAVHCQ
ncbi:unnamed protein product, partial [Symbiodinium sp. KB8]